MTLVTYEGYHRHAPANNKKQQKLQKSAKKGPNIRKMVGLAGVEPTTFTRIQRLAAPTGFFMTAPEFRHPLRSANPLLAFWSPSSYLTRLQPHLQATRHKKELTTIKIYALPSEPTTKSERLK